MVITICARHTTIAVTSDYNDNTLRNTWVVQLNTDRAPIVELRFNGYRA